MEQKPVSSSPFAVDPKESTLADRMYAMYAILRSHEVAQEKHCALPLSDKAKRAFGMGSWDCGTAACAAGSAGLTPWFQELAEFKGVGFQRVFSGMRVEPANFVDRPAIWDDAHADMRHLFLGIVDLYYDIPGVPLPKGNSTQVNLNALTAHQVKEAMRKIIIKHFGNEGMKRCKELDQNCILTD